MKNTQQLESRTRRRARVATPSAPTHDIHEASTSVSTTKTHRGVALSAESNTERERVSESILHPAYVRLGGAITKNCGNYNSVKVDVAISRPCENTDASIMSTTAKISDMVNDIINSELDKAGV